MIQSHTCNSKPIKKPLLAILLTTILCSLSFFLGSYFSFSLPETHHNQRYIQFQQHNVTTQNHISQPLLQFEAHHFLSLPHENSQSFKLCPRNLTHYCPCQDPFREKQFLAGKNFHIEKHCTESSERIRCLIPRPVGCKKPISWPKSRDNVWFNNVPFPKLTEYKKSQNWVRLESERFVFPGGGTSFPKGVKGYVDSIKRFVPLKSGIVRIVLDIGCGVSLIYMSA